MWVRGMGDHPKQCVWHMKMSRDKKEGAAPETCVQVEKTKGDLIQAVSKTYKAHWPVKGFNHYPCRNVLSAERFYART